MKEKSAVISRKIDASKARVILKALMQIGSCLSQTREFRDIFEDILGKVSNVFPLCLRNTVATNDNLVDNISCRYMLNHRLLNHSKTIVA